MFNTQFLVELNADSLDSDANNDVSETCKYNKIQQNKTGKNINL